MSSSALKRGCAAVLGVTTTFSNASSGSSSRRRLVERIEAESAETARSERFDERAALDKLGARGVDQARPRLDARELFAAEKAARRVVEGQLRHDPVALCEQVLQRRVLRLPAPLLLGRNAIALVIEDAHAEGRGALRQLRSDLAEADDAERGPVQRAQARDAAEVRVR